MKKFKLTALFLLIIIAPPFLAAKPVDDLSFGEWALSAGIGIFTGGYPGLTEVRVGRAEDFAPLISGIPETGFRPWPAQLRAAGFINMPEGAVIAVNSGYPILFKSKTGKYVLPDSGFAEEFLADTAGLTTGSLYADDDAAGIHFYRDRFFDNGISPGSASGRPVVIEVSAGALDIFSLNIPQYSFADENPEWEPVELIHKTDENIIAWKYSDEKKSMFRYIIHDSKGEAVDEIDEGYFRDEFELRPADDGPFALRGFMRAVREGAAGVSLKESGDIYLRLPAGSDGPSETVYLSKAPGRGSVSAPVQLQACPDGETWYILYEESVFVCDSNITVNELPPLPGGFKYTGIWVGGGYMLLSWEETRFLYTARSGMILIKMRDILN